MDNELLKVCNKPECTYSQTGICVLSNDPATCSERLASLGQIIPTENETIADAVLPSLTNIRNLKPSLTLTFDAIRELRQDRYYKIIGILGVPGSGKTASLVSLYLLLAQNKLLGYEFLDSRSIMAFEEISRGARTWNQTNLPEQVTVHTELANDRTAGFLHLRLNCKKESQTIDLLFPDLPGEWTNDLILRNRTDRFEFLNSADRIWIMVNGNDHANAVERQPTVHRVGLLIDRLKAYLGNRMLDVTLVVTHCDTAKAASKHLNLFNQQDSNAKFNVRIIEIASFSNNEEDVKPGTGISNLIGDVVTSRRKNENVFWTQKSIESNVRNYLKFAHKRSNDE